MNANRLGLNHWACAACVAGSLVGFSHATNRYYSDQSEVSPNGRYRIEAKSPANADDKSRPFADNFTYTLFDAHNGDRVIWKRQQLNEGSPVDVFVNDRMWVAIRTSGDNLIALKPVTGELAVRFDILEQIPKDEHDQYVSDSTAGPIWAGNSRWYFHESEGHAYFVIRAWWNRRWVTDLTAGKLLAEVPAKLLAELDAADVAWALSILKRDANGFPVDARGYQNVWEAKTAIHLAGRLKVKESVELLRIYEQSEYVGASSSGWSEFTVRQGSQLALRELDQAPFDLPPIVLCAHEGDFPRPPLVALDQCPKRAERSSRVGDLKTGMNCKQMVEVFGHPDVVGGNHYLYDIDDGADSFTIAVGTEWIGDWDKGEERIKSIERLATPTWRQGDRRYHEISW